MGLDTTDIPDGQTLSITVNEKMNTEYDARLIGKIGYANNTYAIGVTQDVMDTYHPTKINDHDSCCRRAALRRPSLTSSPVRAV